MKTILARAMWPVPAVIVLFGCSDGSDPGLFADRVDFSTPGRCTDVRIADVNVDGKPDLALTDFDSSSIMVFRNMADTASREPEFVVDLIIPVGERPVALAVGDLNSDQRADIVVVNRDSNSISILFNTSSSGMTSFSGPTDIATNPRPVAIAVGDLNGDGTPDVAVASQGQQVNGEATISVFLNETGSGETSPLLGAKFDIASGSGTNSIALADINQDGKLDVVGANLSGQAIVSINNTPIGATEPDFASVIEFSADGGSGSIATVDLTGDGSSDLVTGNLNTGTISVLANRTALGSGNPEFAPKLDFEVGNSPISIGVLDADSNGSQDLAVANLGSASVSILVNLITSTSLAPILSSQSELSTGAEPNSIVAGDLNGDGKADLVTANRDATVSVLLAR